MTARTLQFRSPKKIIELRSICIPHTARIGDWSISESFEADTHPYFQRDMGSYELLLQRTVSTQDDVWLGRREAEQIVEQLDIAWCYVCGSPFLSVHCTSINSEAPVGWMGNVREVEIEILKENGLGYADAMNVVCTNWLSAPFLPLEKVLIVREAVLNAISEVRHLIELHIAAHKSDFGKLFFFAKGLELAGAFFGRERAARNHGLQSEMIKLGAAPHLTKPVEWLFEIANTRFDIRHSVNGYSPVTVHPRMTKSERLEFEANADLVIRAFVCSKLGVEINTVLRRAV